MPKMDAKKWVGAAFFALGAIDLLEGNTDKTILPDFIGNVLTQQIDLAPIGVGVLLWML